MAKIRNVSTDTLELRYGGQVLGVAEPDGLIEVSDALAADLEFPEALWRVEQRARAFDPSDKTVQQVLTHLAKADPDERARVLTAERDGKGRAGILNYEQE